MAGQKFFNPAVLAILGLAGEQILQANMADSSAVLAC
jgi:hypothetical protein